MEWEDRCSNETGYGLRRRIEGQADSYAQYSSNATQASFEIVPNVLNKFILTMDTPVGRYESEELAVFTTERGTGEGVAFEYEGVKISVEGQYLGADTRVSFYTSPEDGSIEMELDFGEDVSIAEGRDIEITGFHLFFTLPILLYKEGNEDTVKVTVTNMHQLAEPLYNLFFPHKITQECPILVNEKGQEFIYFGYTNWALDELAQEAFEQLTSYLLKSSRKVKFSFEFIERSEQFYRVCQYEQGEFKKDSLNKTKDKAIVFVHGIGYWELEEINDYWEYFFKQENISGIPGFNFDDYDIYAFFYNSQNSTAKEYGRYLRDQLIEQGFTDYDEIHLIAHSSGTIVTRYAMNYEQFGDNITNAF